MILFQAVNMVGQKKMALMLGLALFTWGGAMADVSNETSRFLGKIQERLKTRIELLDVQGLFGGRNVVLFADGAALVSIVKPSQEGQGLVEQDYLLSLSPKEVELIINQSVIADNIVNLKLEDRLGKPDEARVVINITNYLGENKSHAAWEKSNFNPEEYNKIQRKKFDKLYQRLKNLEKLAKKRGKLIKQSFYKDQASWRASVQKVVSSDQFKAYKNLSQKELKKLFRSEVREIASVIELSHHYTIPVPGLRIYAVLRPIDLVKDPANPPIFVLTSDKKIYYHDQIEEALASTSYFPDSEQEAVSLAKLMAELKQASYYGRKLNFAQGQEPLVTDLGNHYNIKLWAGLPTFEVAGVVISQPQDLIFEVEMQPGKYRIDEKVVSN